MKTTKRGHSSLGKRPSLIMPGFPSQYIPPLQRSKGAQKLTQTDVNELKLQIQELEQKIKKTNVSTKISTDKINRSEKNINKTFEQSTQSTQIVRNSQKLAIPILKDSIAGANSRIESLEEEISNIKTNDRFWQVKEMEQNVIVSYLELKRIKDEDSDEKIRENAYKDIYFEAKAQQDNLGALTKELKAEKAKNASLKDKLDAYMRKQARIQIENNLHKQKDNEAIYIINDSEIEQATDNKKLADNCQVLNTIKEEHAKKLEELDAIINTQCAGLKQFLIANKEELNKNISLEEK